MAKKTTFPRRLAKLSAAILLVFLSSECLAQRPAWTSSQVQGSPTPPLPCRTEQAYGGIKFDHPVEMANAPGTASMFVLEQGGDIYELPSEDVSKPTLIGKLSDHAENFQFAYGLDFHPDFQNNREIYVCYRQKGENENGTIAARFRLTDGKPMKIEPNSETILYTWRAGGHNGGSVKFGPDGYLYISAGDAAAPFPPDPYKAGQDVGSILSTITRIDVNNKSDDLPYAIPRNNPFVDLEGARPEVFAYGFRNPWRMAFDRETGQLWVGDVGWELWEMIYAIESGGNYGWSLVEGPHTVNRDYVSGPTPVLKPAASHPHTEARSITGGQVYYGSNLPELRGKYVYGDHVTGRIWSLKKTEDGFEGPTEIARSALQIICFALNDAGEMYVVDYLGTIHKLVRQHKRSTNQEFPRKLSQSGLFSDTSQMTLADGVLPYSIIAEPWMDGGTATRFIGVPGEKQIDVYRVGSGWSNWDGKHRGSWKFPKNTVLGKTISLEGRRVETQLMHYDGQAWQAYSYLWNDAQTDAELADDVSQTIQIDIDGTQHSWLVSNRGDCMICHSNANDMLLGFKPEQLRRPTEQHEDQLDYFASLKLFAKPPPNSPTIADPLDEEEALDSRARAYLHLNCAHCHRPDGGGSVAMNVLFRASAKQTRMIDEPPLQGSFGIPNAKVVASGDPYRSILFYRFSKLGPGHMPKLGGLEVDQRGAELLHDWILSLDHDAVDTQKQLTLLNEAADTDKLATWLAVPSHGLVATQAIRTDQLKPALRHQIIDLSRSLPDISKDLFEPFIPVSQRTERLGDNIAPARILSSMGDATRGRELFLSESLSCKNCHSVESGKESTGPNLASLKRKQYVRTTLLENIMAPSKKINKRYLTHVIQTADGEIFTGVVQPEEGGIVLRDAEGKLRRIANDDIEFRKVSEVSLMPDKLLSTLTLEQAQDLLAYLSSLAPEP